jgi:hypothetical protein
MASLTTRTAASSTICARRPDDSFIRTARALEINDLGKDNDAAAREENARLAAQIEELKSENARLHDQLAQARTPPAHKANGSSPLRNDVRLVQSAVAVRVGVPAAMMLQQVFFVIRTGGGRILDDPARPYVATTYPEWRDKYFPFFSVITIKRAFVKLEKKNLIESKQADGRQSRKKSYRPTPEGIKLIPSGKEPSNCAHRRDQNDPFRMGSNCALPYYNESESKGTRASTSTENGFIKGLSIKAPEARVPVFEGKHQEHAQPARDDPKWPDYAAYCESQKGKRDKNGRPWNGMPSQKGFWTWLKGQDRRWRDRVKQPDFVDGYDLDGAFYTKEEADQMAKANADELLSTDRFRPARKHPDGTHEIVYKQKGNQQ